MLEILYRSFLLGLLANSPINLTETALADAFLKGVIVGYILTWGLDEIRQVYLKFFEDLLLIKDMDEVLIDFILPLHFEYFLLNYLENFWNSLKNRGKTCFLSNSFYDLVFKAHTRTIFFNLRCKLRCKCGYAWQIFYYFFFCILP